MKFYANEIPLEIVTSSFSTPKSAYVLGSASVSHIFDHYLMAMNGQIVGKSHLFFVVKNYDKTIEELKEKFKVIHAAGGIVSKKEELLFIKRLGKWDLPKGKVEKGEDVADAAQREVEEECGVETTLGEKIGETWHTYQFKGKNVLKCTHWYEMQCSNDQALAPQVEEDIEEVIWLDQSKVEEKILPNTYQTIRDILTAHNKG